MKLSASQAAKEVSKSLPTITRAIKSGRLSAQKTESGAYEIDPAELFRVWPEVTDNSNATPKMLGSETPNVTSALELEIKLLRERLDEVKEDRDKWREQAQKITLLIEADTTRAQADKRGFFDKLIGL